MVTCQISKTPDTLPTATISNDFFHFSSAHLSRSSNRSEAGPGLCGAVQGSICLASFSEFYVDLPAAIQSILTWSSFRTSSRWITGSNTVVTILIWCRFLPLGGGKSNDQSSISASKAIVGQTSPVYQLGLCTLTKSSFRTRRPASDVISCFMTGQS